MANELVGEQVMNARRVDPATAIPALGGAGIAIAWPQNPQSFRRVRLHAAGRMKVIAVDRKLDEVNESADAVLASTTSAASSSDSDGRLDDLVDLQPGVDRRAARSLGPGDALRLYLCDEATQDPLRLLSSRVDSLRQFCLPVTG